MKFVEVTSTVDVGSGMKHRFHLAGADWATQAKRYLARVLQARKEGRKRSARRELRAAKYARDRVRHGV